MVDRQLLTAATAVLATVIVPMKHVASGERQLAERHAHVLAQPNHCGEVGATTDFPAGILLKTFSLALEHHHHGTTPSCDVQRLVGRIENENLAHASSLNTSHAIDSTKPPLVTLSTKAPCRS